MKKPEFINGEMYHIYNRGVEKRKIFLVDKDRFRFIHDLFEFNDVKPALPSNLYFSIRNPSNVSPEKISQCLEVEPLNIEKKREKTTSSILKRKRKLLVELLAFCLMPNHYHLLVRQKVNGGIVKFMHKIGTGYTVYFNQKNKRVGSLFQGRFKAAAIRSESHFISIPYYIHLNPLDLIAPKWKEKPIKNLMKSMKFLENYRWSSFPDYLNKKNFPSVTQREYLNDILGTPTQHKKDIKDWLIERDLSDINDLLLE